MAPSMSFEEAAAIPQAATLALQLNKDLAYMNDLFEAGKVVPVTDGPYRLSEVPEAFRRYGAGRHAGKVVITVESDGRS